MNFITDCHKFMHNWFIFRLKDYVVSNITMHNVPIRQKDIFI